VYYSSKYYCDKTLRMKHILPEGKDNTSGEIEQLIQLLERS
jgi:hypothetical protein